MFVDPKALEAAKNKNQGINAADVGSKESKTKATEQTARKLYGRKWKIEIFKPAYKKEKQKDGTTKSIRDPEHDTSIDVSLLRCIFSIKHKVDTFLTQCSLVVYNLNAVTEGSVLTEGFQIRIEGGYVEGQYGELFTGDIVQCFRNRENGIDYRLEIVALNGIFELPSNFTRGYIGEGSQPRTQINAIANNSKHEIKVGEVSPDLKKEPLPRGKVYFGTPAKYLRQIAIKNDAHFWIQPDGKLTMKKVTDEIPEDQCLVLTPTTGLIGTPVYSDNGIQISMLLDPRVKAMTLIKIDNQIIRRMAANLDQMNAMAAGPNLLDKGKTPNSLPQSWQFDIDGEYQVYSLTHSGDTWGDTWKTDVVAVSRLGRCGLLAQMQNKGNTSR